MVVGGWWWWVAGGGVILEFRIGPNLRLRLEAGTKLNKMATQRHLTLWNELCM